MRFDDTPNHASDEQPIQTSNLQTRKQRIRTVNNRVGPPETPGTLEST